MFYLEKSHGIPKLSIDYSVFDEIIRYPSLCGSNRILILADCIEENNSVTIVGTNVPPQDDGYNYHKWKKDVINPLTGYLDDKTFKTIYRQCLIQVDSYSGSPELSEEDVRYFSGLTDVDWLIVGSVNKKQELYLYFIDKEINCVWTFCSEHNESKAKFDGVYLLSNLLNKISDDDIKVKLENVEKTKTVPVTPATTTTAVAPKNQPSELAKNPPPLANLS